MKRVNTEARMEQAALQTVRTGRETRIGVFGWLLEKGYIVRDRPSKEYVLTTAGIDWFKKA